MTCLVISHLVRLVVLGICVCGIGVGAASGATCSRGC